MTWSALQTAAFRLVLAWTLCGVLHAQESTPSAAHGQTLNRFLAACKERREAIKSVRYICKGEALIPKDAFAIDGHVLPDDYRHALGGEWLVDFTSNWFRIQLSTETFNASTGAFAPDDDIWGYDGQGLFCNRQGVTANRPTHYPKIQPEFYYHNLTYPVLTVLKMPPIVAHGYVPNGFVSEDKNRQKIVPLIGDHLHVHGTGAIDGKTHVVARTRPNPRSTTLELWIEPGSLLVRRINMFEVNNFEGKKMTELRAVVDMDHRQSDGVHLLSGWRYTQNAGRPRKGATKMYSFSVQQIDRNPAVAISDVRLEPSEKMVVKDDPEDTAYIIGPEGAHLPIREADAPKGASEVLILVIVICCGVGLVIALVRLRKRRLGRDV